MTDKQTCPWCKQEFSPKGITGHMRACKERPPDDKQEKKQEQPEGYPVPMEIIPQDVCLFPDKRLTNLHITGRKIGDQFYIEDAKVVR